MVIDNLMKFYFPQNKSNAGLGNVTVGMKVLFFGAIINIGLNYFGFLVLLLGILSIIIVVIPLIISFIIQNLI